MSRFSPSQSPSAFTAEPRGAHVYRPGVTIAIPNWNHEYLLPRSIKSALRAVELLGQVGVPAETIVFDDASRDGSLTLLRQLEALLYDKGLRVVAYTQNRGLSVMRNQALLQANYRYVIFMDADNELLSENVYQFYRAITDTGAAVVYGNLMRLGVSEAEVPILSNE